METIDRVVVATAASESSATVQRILLTATSATGNIEAQQAFQQTAADVVTLLWEIEAAAHSGSDAVSRTREQFARAVLLVDLARRLMSEGNLQVDPVDVEELIRLMNVLDGQYHPR